MVSFGVDAFSVLGLHDVSLGIGGVVRVVGDGDIKVRLAIAGADGSWDRLLALFLGLESLDVLCSFLGVARGLVERALASSDQECPESRSERLMGFLVSMTVILQVLIGSMSLVDEFLLDGALRFDFLLEAGELRMGQRRSGGFVGTRSMIDRGMGSLLRVARVGVLLDLLAALLGHVDGGGGLISLVGVVLLLGTFVGVALLMMARERLALGRRGLVIDFFVEVQVQEIEVGFEFSLHLAFLRLEGIQLVLEL